MKVLLTTVLLAFASFSAFAQLDIDVENISGEDVFVDIAKMNDSKCIPVCYMSNTITVDFIGVSGGVDARFDIY